MLRLSLVLLSLLVLPAQAHAAEGFLGVTEQGQLVRFSTQNPWALTTPVTPRGLAPGERVVAIGQAQRGLVAVGSSARLYALDTDSGQATPIGDPFAQGMRGSRFSLAVAPGGKSARLLSDVGQDLVVDLSTGATSPGPGLRRADTGAPLRPAADADSDGRLIGVQFGPLAFLHETAPGASTMAASPLEELHVPALGEPLAFQLGSDGRGYAVAVLSDLKRVRQSVMLVLDRASSKLVGGVTRGLKFMSRRIETFASIGRVAEDRTPPRVRVMLPRQISARTLLDQRLPLSVRASEAAVITVSLRVAGQGIGFTTASRDTPGTVVVRSFPVLGRDKNRIRRGVGRRLRVVIGINDHKSNRVSVVRTVRLVR